MAQTSLPGGQHACPEFWWVGKDTSATMPAGGPPGHTARADGSDLPAWWAARVPGILVGRQGYFGYHARPAMAAPAGAAEKAATVPAAGLAAVHSASPGLNGTTVPWLFGNGGAGGGGGKGGNGAGGGLGGGSFGLPRPERQASFGPPLRGMPAPELISLESSAWRVTRARLMPAPIESIRASFGPPLRGMPAPELISLESSAWRVTRARLMPA